MIFFHRCSSSIIALAALCLSASTITPTKASGLRRSKQDARDLRTDYDDPLLQTEDSNDPLLCQVLVVDTEYEIKDSKQLDAIGIREQSFDCLPLNHGGAMTYDLELEEDFVSLYADYFEEGDSTIISIPNGVIVNGTVKYPAAAEITIVHEDSNRRLSDPRDRHHGTYSLLVVTAQAPDSQLSVSIDLIRDRVFNTGQLSLVSQLDRCSYGKVVIEPAEGPGIDRGVMKVNLHVNVTGMRNRDVERRMVHAVQNRFGSESHFDYVVYCVPPGTPGWIAYGFLNFPRSVFNDYWCAQPSTLLHEVGHNMNLHHAGEVDLNGNTNGYGDTSGYMGASSHHQSLGPARCYNAQKNWYLRWYQDKSIELDIQQGAWAGHLVGVVEYDLADPEMYEYVIVKVGKLYLQYNRAKDFNYQTGERADHVTIVHAERDYGMSMMIASISTTDSSVPSTYRYENFDGNGADLVIEVCEQVEGPPDHARVSIFLDDGTQEQTCDTELLATEECEDSKFGTYYIDERRGNKTCPWLSLAPAWQKILCVEDHPAFHLCPETCGKCTDTCEDTPGEYFRPNLIQPPRDCDWLSTKPVWQFFLCRQGHRAYDLCAESCDRCG